MGPSTPTTAMRGSRKVCQRGSDIDTFLVDEGKGESNHNYKRATIGPPTKRHLMAIRWRADDGPTLNAGLVALWFPWDPDQYC